MNESCPLPGPKGSDEAASIARMLRGKRIAVVGLSDNPSRASQIIAEYLLAHGYEVVPVNPNHEEFSSTDLLEILFGSATTAQMV